MASGGLKPSIAAGEVFPPADVAETEEEEEEEEEEDGEEENEWFGMFRSVSGGGKEEEEVSVVVSDALESDFPIIYINAVFQEATGYLPHEVLGRNCFEIIRHIEGILLWTLWRSLKCVGVLMKVQNSGELLNFHKDGTPLVNRLRLMPIHANDGMVTHIIGIQIFSEANIDVNLLSYPVFKEPFTHKCSQRKNTDAFTLEHDRRTNSLSDYCGLLQLSDEVLAHNILSHLTPRDIASVSSVCSRMRQLTKNEHLRKMVCQNAWGKEVTNRLEFTKRGLGWGRLVRELTTFEAAVWRKFTVGGRVSPSRCNFSVCAAGNRLVLFGGEGINMQPMDDTFVLNLDSSNPEWRQVQVASPPPGRWGHTLSSLNESLLVMFGGCGQNGLLNDVFVLELDAQQPAWRQVAGAAPPLPRSWHSSCCLGCSQLVVSGGCTNAGTLLNDTFLLDLTNQKSTWREILTSWAPPSRLGHTLSSYGTSKILMFGGLVKSGSQTLRSADAYTIDLDDDEPQWGQLNATGFLGIGPPPRLDHVAVSLPCGRILVFGGSIAGLHSASQLFLLDPLEEKPAWRVLNIPGQPPKVAWGHSACVVGGTRVLLLGGHTGDEWSLNELHELCLASRPD